MFIPFTPIMAAMSASTSILKGQLSDHDMRWEVIEQAVDCRTESEKDPNSKQYIPKSRYSTVSNYLSNHEYVKDFHNDLEKQRVPEDALNMLLENGLDDRLAFHISSLFIRAPVPVYEKELMFPSCAEESDEKFESPLQAKKKELLSSEDEQNEEVGLTQSPREYVDEEQGIDFLDPEKNASSTNLKKRDIKFNQKLDQNKLKVVSNKKQTKPEQALTSTSRSNIDA